MSRYFIFLRQEVNENCNAFLYWKPIQQGGCFVGKIDTEMQAISHAKKIFQYYIDNYQEGHPERAINYHIVDTLFHRILLVGNDIGVEYLDVEDSKQKKEQSDTMNVLDYSTKTITSKQLGRLNGKD